MGGGIVQVDLRRPSTLTRKADAGRCDRKDWSALVEESRKQGKRVDPDRIQKRCGRMSTRRCLDPPLAGVEIILRYVDPLGNVIYRTVVTDADGCYEDFLVSTTGGTCQVTAEYPSSKCEAPAVGGPITVCWCHD